MPRRIDELLPHYIYMTLDTPLSRAKVNSLFTKRGWSSRMCSWTEHEITSSYAELVIASESPMLINGGVDRDPRSIDKIIAILDDAGISSKFDVYDEHDTLLRSQP